MGDTNLKPETYGYWGEYRELISMGDTNLKPETYGYWGEEEGCQSV